MQPKKLLDYHLHTASTIDCKMTEAQVCEQANQLGIQEIAFTNHIMLTQPDYTISPEAFVTHWEQIRTCQQRYPQMRILLGIEMDYYEGREKEIAETLQRYENLIARPFDFVLGSIHDLHGRFFSNKNCAQNFYNDHDLISLYHDYFYLSAMAVNTRLFDVIAHPDLIKKYTHDLTPHVPFKRYRNAVETFIDALLNSGVGIEVNTKGLTLKVGEMYPSNEFLELYILKAASCSMEPILTIGSDAHSAEDVGRNIAKGIAELKYMGIKSLASFEKRKWTVFTI